MTAYRYSRYRAPRRYRRVRYPYRFRSRKQQNAGAFPVVAIVGAVLLAGAGAGAKAVVHHAPKPAAKAPAVTDPAAAGVIAFARSKVGKVPYAWGGTTDAGMDCSGLAQSAYAAAGVPVERTSQEQWASERRVPGSEVTAGDLVFFAGSDGTATAPGHVGIVVNPAAHTMIDAYETGTYVRYDTYGLASSAPGLGTVVGFTDPDPKAPASPVTAAAPGPGETGYVSALLAAVGAPDDSANEDSVADWARLEGPWGTVGRWNPLSTTLAEPGSWNFNTFDGDLHVQSYPTEAEGVRATAATLLSGYPQIVSALRSGAGVCGTSLAGEFGEWSGNYEEVC
jgi:hypothetical protein